MFMNNLKILLLASIEASSSILAAFDAFMSGITEAVSEKFDIPRGFSFNLADEKVIYGMIYVITLICICVVCMLNCIYSVRRRPIEISQFS